MVRHAVPLPTGSPVGLTCTSVISVVGTSGPGVGIAGSISGVVGIALAVVAASLGPGTALPVGPFAVGDGAAFRAIGVVGCVEDGSAMADVPTNKEATMRAPAPAPAAIDLEISILGVSCNLGQMVT